MTSTFHPKMTADVAPRMGSGARAEDVAQGPESADFAQRAIAAGFEVRVQHQSIDFAAEIDPITRNPKVGAVVNLLGVVRQFGVWKKEIRRDGTSEWVGSKARDERAVNRWG